MPSGPQASPSRKRACSLDRLRLGGGVSQQSFSVIPPDISLRDYPKDAVPAWLDAGGRGILAMATGAGKTLTVRYNGFLDQHLVSGWS